MNDTAPPRRVVTGLDSEGRPCVLIDGPATRVIWSTEGAVADNSGTADAGGGRLSFPTSGTRFLFNDFPPHSEPMMHATDTIDYIVVAFGEVVLVTETGETLLKAGDVVVDRGVMHAWRNDGDTPCRIVCVLSPALPVADGASISGEVGG